VVAFRVAINGFGRIGRMVLRSSIYRLGNTTVSSVDDCHQVCGLTLNAIRVLEKRYTNCLKPSSFLIGCSLDIPSCIGFTADICEFCLGSCVEKIPVLVMPFCQIETHKDQPKIPTKKLLGSFFFGADLSRGPPLHLYNYPETIFFSKRQS